MRRLVYRRILVALIMAVLFYPMLGTGHHFPLQERVQPVARPAHFWKGILDRQWQPYLKQQFLQHIEGARSFLIVFYNEAIHRLFPTRPNDHYVWTPGMGFYPVDTIQRLNDEVLHHDAIAHVYQMDARRLRILQQILGHHGVTLLFIAPPPKIRIYPAYASQYLLVPAQDVVKRGVSYADILEKAGVHVLGVQRMFLAGKDSSPWPYFTTTSFHWSYWAGCTMADAMMQKAQALSGQPFFPIDCSQVHYGPSKWADADIADILNIFSTNEVIGKAPFPIIHPKDNDLEEHHRILIIGDSFSDHLIYALSHALPERSWSPDWLTRYDYFVSRQTFGWNGDVISRTPLQPSAALPEVLTKDLVVIEVSDGNIYRDAGNLDHMEYGATYALLSGLMQRADVASPDPADMLTGGWQGEARGVWRTTGTQASLAVPTPTDGHPIRLALDIEARRSPQHALRQVQILLDGGLIGSLAVPKGRGKLHITLPGKTRYTDHLITELTLRDPEGKPLGLLLHGIRIVGMAQKLAGAGAVQTMKPRPTRIDTGGSESINLISSQHSKYVYVQGLSGLEGNGKENWRWATGPSTQVRFYIDPESRQNSRRVTFKFTFKNGVPIPSQQVDLVFNGKKIRTFFAGEIGVEQAVSAEIPLTAIKGTNILEFFYKDWVHKKNDYGSHDPRKLAVVFTRLSLQKEGDR